jgi:hypothetical protein
MTPTTTRRALLAGSTMFLAGRTAAQQQGTTLKLYSAVYEIEAAMVADQVQERTKSDLVPWPCASEPQVRQFPGRELN